MKRNCKRAWWVSLGCVLLIGLISGQTASHVFGADPAFVTAKAVDGVTEFEAIQDVQTGLMWGKDIDKIDHMLATEYWVNVWANGDDTYNPGGPDLNQTGGYAAWSGENPTGWRPPTVGEVLVAIDHGLADYIDLSYAEGHQEVNTPLVEGDPEYGQPGIVTWGDWYFWTACMTNRIKKFVYRYRVRYRNGHYVWSQGGYSVLAVRGAPPDHSLCPKECSQAPTGGGKPPKK